MRKQKKFELMAIMEEFKTVKILENDTFYTRDTEAFLIFITEPNYEFDSATIALLNRDDGSLISVDQNPVVDGVTEYEMPVEVIAHYGKWNAQLIYHKGEEDYTSPLVSFTVERFLTDSRPPRLEEVESIAKLRKEAKELIEVLEGMTYDNDSLVDVLQAKDGELTLDARIKRDVNNLENKKADKAEVSAQLADKIDIDGSGQVGWANIAQDAREQIIGTTPPAVVGTNAVLESNLTDNAVTERKTSFVNMGKNLFDKAKVTTGKYVHPTNGILADNARYSVSDYIDVLAGQTYTWNNNVFYAWYSSAKEFISSGGVADSLTPTTEVAPANAAFLRTSLKNTQLDTFQVESGSEVTAYETFGYVIKNVKLEDSVFNAQFTALDSAVFQEKYDSAEVIVEPNHLSGYALGKNLFNKDKATAGGYINAVSGTIRPGPDFYYSEYIPVTPGTKLVKKGTYSYAFYDANKTFISGSNSGKVLEVPENAFFVRISTYKEMFSGTPGINEEQLELGTVSTFYEPYNFSVKYLTIPKTTEETVILNLPAKINALVGQELNIYFDNVVSGKDSDYEFDVVCSVGKHYDKFYRLTPTVSGSNPFTLVVYKNSVEVARGTSTIVVSASSVGNAVTKKLLIIGDSTTDNDYLVSKLQTNFAADVMNIETIGTRGVSPNKHEGRAGWTTDMFMGLISGYTSPFMFSGVFDFSEYILTNGLATPDYVAINLGINDLFGITGDTTLTTKMNTIVSQYETMIESIKTQNPSVKIGICLTIPPNYSQDAFGVAYANGQTLKRYKRNVILFVKKLMESFGGREAENIYLVPIHLNLDTRNNFPTEQKQINARNATMVSYPTSTAGVHPADSGYWQIADSYWYWMKSFEA